LLLVTLLQKKSILSYRDRLLQFGVVEYSEYSVTCNK